MRRVEPNRELHVRDLQVQREARGRVNHETYKQLLAQAQGRIRARAANGATDLLWQVPPLVPGRPVYTVFHAARYVSDKLRRGGFEVTVASPGSDVHALYVSWSPTAARGTAWRQPSSAASASSSSRSSSEARPSLAVSMSDATRSLEKLKARLRLS